ncbi:MAG TPA: GDP-L-fucose synthase [Rhodocyclaceae bacterium]|nr:GDP-L-fucose synthase [Rhodocyclaceae bacterium]
MNTRQVILLTGGSGMVGCNLREHPLANQWAIIAPSRKELDLRDYQQTENYLRKLQPDLIIHAAGLVGGIQANMANPVDFLVTNVDIGRNVILGARAAGIKKLINLASSCMYPRAGINPLSEDLILQGELEPTNEGYALAKIFSTRLCQYVMRENHECRYKTLIPCNLFGRHDKFSPANSHLVPAIIYKMHAAKLSNATTIDIWGDGTARREFMYAGDFAQAVLHAIETFDRLPDLMNIGVGRDFSINEYYESAAAVVGWQGRFVHDLSKPVGMKQKLVSIERQTAWGWSPQSTLHEGLTKTYSYFLEQLKNDETI